MRDPEIKKFVPNTDAEISILYEEHEFLTC